LFSLGFLPRIKPVCFIVLLFTFFRNTLTAQENLVPNGSFEEYIICPEDGALNKAKYFSSPTQSSPDYFNSCAMASNNTSIPSNLGGFQEPRSGSSYAGIVTYGFGTNYKEYIQTSLVKTLEMSKFYLVKYYVSLGSYSSTAINKIGVFFSDQQITENINTTLLYEDNLFTDSVIMDTLNWVELSFIYQAKGNENFILLGNFHDDFFTDTLNCPGGIGDNYYYIDDISVIEINVNVPNVFSPNSDGINDVLEIEDLTGDFEITIVNRWGQKVFQTNNLTMSSWNGENFPDGVYFYTLTDKKKVINKTGFIHLIR
jgi:gliding motility-associated-like protein